MDGLNEPGLSLSPPVQTAFTVPNTFVTWPGDVRLKTAAALIKIIWRGGLYALIVTLLMNSSVSVKVRSSASLACAVAAMMLLAQVT